MPAAFNKYQALNKRISIFAPVVVDDGMGGSMDTATALFCTAWAGIWPVRANEARENMRSDVTVTHTIRIRYISGLTNAMTIKFGTRTFEIKGMINPDEANRYIDMICEEKSA